MVYTDRAEKIEQRKAEKGDIIKYNFLISVNGKITLNLPKNCATRAVAITLCAEFNQVG